MVEATVFALNFQGFFVFIGKKVFKSAVLYVVRKMKGAMRSKKEYIKGLLYLVGCIILYVFFIIKTMYFL
jgi:hypothetical protein